VDLYIHSSIRLNGVVLNQLSTGTTLHFIKKNAETLIEASREVGLEVNAEKIKDMLLSRNKNAGQNLYLKIPHQWYLHLIVVVGSESP
jgi:hypothetical protein